MKMILIGLVIHATLVVLNLDGPPPLNKCVNPGECCTGDPGCIPACSDSCAGCPPVWKCMERCLCQWPPEE
jgi:hypothetical protein